MTSRRAGRLGLVAALVCLAALVWAGPARAHAQLLRSEPAEGARLQSPPEEIRLWFNEPISAAYLSARLLDVNGRPVEPLSFRREASDPTLLVVQLPPLAEGLYSVSWRVLSEADGHFTQGLLVFGVGEGVWPDAAGESPPPAPLPAVEVLLRWLNFGLAAALAGALAVLNLALPGIAAAEGGKPLAGQARRRLLAWASACGAASLAVGFGLLLWQALLSSESLPEGVSPWQALWAFAASTRWGALWFGRQALLLALLGLTLALRRAPQKPGAGGMEAGEQASLPARRAAEGLAGLLAAGLMVLQALGGHAAALTGGEALAVASDALHLIAGAAWLGGLAAMAVGLLPLLRRAGAAEAGLARLAWSPFSRMAAASVLLVAATGLYNTGRQVASPDALVTTLYGRALLSKIGLMVLAGGFGLASSSLLHPALLAPLARLARRPAGWSLLPARRLPALVFAEACLGALIFLAAGVITALPPARGPAFAPPPTEAPGSLSQEAGDLLVNLAVQPNRPGPNVFLIRVSNTRRPPPAEILRVIVRFTFLEEQLGSASADAEPQEPGLYRLGGGYLGLAGRWRIEVVVRRKGLEDSVAQFDWTVASPAPARPALLSNRPLEPYLSWAAAALLLAGGAIAGGLGLRRRSWPGGISGM